MSKHFRIKSCTSHCCIQVVKASVAKGKPEFEVDGQLVLDLNESTASLDFILSSVRDKWGSHYILVTNDGIEIEETSVPIGMHIFMGLATPID